MCSMGHKEVNINMAKVGILKRKNDRVSDAKGKTKRTSVKKP